MEGIGVSVLFMKTREHQAAYHVSMAFYITAFALTGLYTGVNGVTVLNRYNFPGRVGAKGTDGYGSRYQGGKRVNCNKDSAAF